MKITQPLRDEHQELLPAIQGIENLADSLGTLSQPEIQKKVNFYLDFLQKQLIPHAIAEDEVLYSKIDELASSHEVTKTMRYDHGIISKLTNRLAKAMIEDKQKLQKLLYQLFILLSLHFQKEEEIYLPFLDKMLDPKDAKELFEHMERVAATIKANQNK